MRINFGTHVESKPRKCLSFCISLFPWNIARLFCPLYLGILGRRIPTRLLRESRRSATASLQSTAPAVLHKRFSMSSRTPRRRYGNGNGSSPVAMCGHGSSSKNWGDGVELLNGLLTNLWTWWRNWECMFPAEMKDWWCELITIYLLYRTYSDDTSATQKAYVFAAWMICHVAMGSLSFPCWTHKGI